MNKKIFRIMITLVLALSLLFSLSACGDKSESGKESADQKGENAGNKQEGTVPENTPEFVYVPEYKKIEGSFQNSFYNSQCTSDGIIAMTQQKVGENIPEGVTPEYEGQYDVWGTVLYKFGFDGSAEKLNYQLTNTYGEVDGRETYSNISEIIPADNGDIYILENVSTSWFEAPEGVTQDSPDYWNYYKYENHYYLNCLKADGTVGERIDLSGLGEGEEYFYPCGCAIDGEGNFYIASENGVYLIDSTGAIKGKAESESWVENIYVLPDGRVCALNYGEKGYQLTVIDPATMSFGENIELKGNNMYNLIPGNDSYDFYYNNGSNLFGYDLESGESTKILNWINCDVDVNGMGQVCITEDNRVIFLESEYNDDYTECTNSLCILTQKPYESVPHKETLTYATLYLDYSIRSKIIEFNRKNPQYRIEVREYSEYNTQEDYTAGATKLRTEIMSGNVPDIISFGDLTVDELAAQGLLEDLYPYIDADAELDRSDFFESVLTGLEVDGKLYSTVTSFSINTIMGASSVVGDEPGWTVDEFKAALASMPEGCDALDYSTTKDDILSNMLAMDMDSYVNFGTGECKFNTPEFISMLEFANSFQAKFDWEKYEYSEDDDTYNRIMSGRQMLMNSYIYDFYEYRMYEAMFGGDVTFIGYPVSQGVGNSLSLNGVSMGISSKSQHKDVAWEFIREMFTEEYQANDRYNYGFPANKNAFNKKLEEAMTPIYRKDAEGNFVLDENGNKIEESQGGWGWGSLTVEMYALTQEQADKMLELINTTTRIQNYNQELIEIVRQEVKPYFEGQKTAQDVAKIVQSKVNIFVNEQR